MSDEERRYSYGNLVLSCSGYPPPADNHDLPDPKNISCAQHKRDSFDDTRFLYPTTEKNISDYFNWNSETGGIVASEKDPSKASYMIDILNIDCRHLRDARRNAFVALVNTLNPESAPEDLDDIIRRILSGKV